MGSKINKVLPLPIKNWYRAITNPVYFSRIVTLFSNSDDIVLKHFRTMPIYESPTMSTWLVDINANLYVERNNTGFHINWSGLFLVRQDKFKGTGLRLIVPAGDTDYEPILVRATDGYVGCVSFKNVLKVEGKYGDREVDLINYSFAQKLTKVVEKFVIKSTFGDILTREQEHIRERKFWVEMIEPEDLRVVETQFLNMYTKHSYSDIESPQVSALIENIITRSDYQKRRSAWPNMYSTIKVTKIENAPVSGKLIAIRLNMAIEHTKGVFKESDILILEFKGGVPQYIYHNYKK